MRRLHFAIAFAALAVSAPPTAASAEVYASKGESSIPRTTSNVVLVRDGDRTTVTIVPHDHRETNPLVMIIPVPATMRRDDVKLRNAEAVHRLHADTYPRFEESEDIGPCKSFPTTVSADGSTITITELAPTVDSSCCRSRSWSVDDSDRDDVYYPLTLLSPEESAKIESWLTNRGHRPTAAALEQLTRHALRGSKFLVVDLNESWRALSPRAIQFTYDSGEFTLPIARDGADLVLHAITRSGRVLPVNYDSVKPATGKTVPLVDSDAFYSALLDHEAKKHLRPVVFTEYVGEARSTENLGPLGVNWDGRASITRLLVRDERAGSPSNDLILRIDKADRTPFRVHNVMHVPYPRSTDCGPPGAKYRKDLRGRQEKTKKTLLELTGRSEITP